jgi:tetratricopeptide (TPR) repeat protein
MKKMTLLMLSIGFVLHLNANIQVFAAGENNGLPQDTLRNAVSDSSDKYLSEARKQQQEGNLPDALILYKKVASLEPDNDEAYIGWFGCCAGAGQIEEGLKAISLWTEKNPDHAKAWLYKAFAEAHANHHMESLQAFDRLIELQPDESSNWVGKGQMLYAMKHYQEAVYAFNRSIEMGPERADVMGMKAAALARLGRFDDAFTAINRVLELSPDDAVGYYNRACIYSIQGNREKALADLKKSVTLNKKMKSEAQRDEDFSGLRSDPEFIELTK